mmetsp:Transcript_8429/g.17956  ORF Transcript_8429/g.17956 Transcript_8429/m.17956 type:complete len:198 (+) Transcript_8429:144-737(+)
MTDKQYAAAIYDGPSQGILSFLFQFALSRAMFDLGFFGGHYVIHHPKLYAFIHRKHHEHFEPTVATNNNFAVLDLMIEAMIPFTAGLATLAGLRSFGFRTTRFERGFITYSFLWYLNGSHAGKALPVVSIFPPLSFIPAIDEVLGGGVAHHHAHHRLVRCNYGIAAWPDKIFGTCRELPPLRTGQQDKEKGQGQQAA